MSECTIGEIRLFPYATVVPSGWMPCEGQILTIQGNQALYALLGIQYGGDGKINFALPDLRGRTPTSFWPGSIPDTNRIGVPTGLQMGNKGGAETITLTVGQIPAHTHSFAAEPSNASGPAITASVPSTSSKQTNAPASAPAAPAIYAPPGTLVPVNPGFIGGAGGNGAHENRQPYLALRYCICTVGYFPQRN